MKKLFAMVLFVLFCGTAAAQNAWKISDDKNGDKVEYSRRKAGANPQITVGYAPFDSYIYIYDGLGAEKDGRIGAAIKLTRPMLERYAGARIVALNIGWSNPEYTSPARCFIREELNGGDIRTGQGDLDVGWNEVRLEEAYTIPENVENLYVGYYTDLRENSIAIPTFRTGASSDACYLWREGDVTGGGDEVWRDFTKDFGVLSIQAVVEGEPGRFDNMMEMGQVRYYSLQTIGDLSSSLYTVTNHGMNSIRSIELSYSKDGEKWSGTYDLDNAIAPSETRLVTLPVYAMGTGTQTASITKVNGEDNRIEASCELSILGIDPDVAKGFTRRSLIEFWESENSYHVPTYYDEYFYPGYEPYAGRASLVSHHLNDQFMQGDDEDTGMMLDFANNDSASIYIPAIMADRTDIFSYPAANTISVASPVVLPDFAYIVYDASLAVPTFASVDAKAYYDAENSTGKIDVTGRIAGGVVPEDELLYLTVYVLEDGIVSDSQVFNDEEEEERYGGLYTHDNVIRFRPTPLYGVEIGNGGEYSQEFSVRFEPDWKPENMRVVAFINRDIRNGHLDREVINTGECAFSGAGSVSILTDGGGIAVYTQDGKICADGEYDRMSVYDLTGRQVENRGLAKGVYLVRVSARNGDFIKKIFVR